MMRIRVLGDRSSRKVVKESGCGKEETSLPRTVASAGIAKPGGIMGTCHQHRVKTRIANKHTHVQGPCPLLCFVQHIKYHALLAVSAALTITFI